MKKSDLKKLIKPIINECIKESLMEDGLISGIIAEVVKGMTAGQPLVEQKVQPQTPDPEMERLKKNAFSEKQTSQLQEHRTKLMSAIGGKSFNGVDLFEGTTPAPTQTNPAQQSGAMAGQSASDAGVDIGSLFGSVGKNWNAHMSDVKTESR
tara:strand:- start:7122 stop:7577 length:456 start_codon:yes stop_codon:yes gene_type:complete